MGDQYDSQLFPHGRFLLTPPTFFDVTYEINPWMDVERVPHGERAGSQWRRLHHTLLRLGAWVEYLDPQKGVPDLVFTANAGLISGKKVLLARFRHPERQAEDPYNRAWFEARGFEIVELTSGYFEGEGDALFAGSTLFCGYGFRTDKRIYKEVARLLEVQKTVLCELVDSRFYHLDTCFCPLTSSRAFFYPPAFSPASVKAMEKEIELLPIEEQDAVRFACNGVVLGRDIIIPSGCDETEALLANHGYSPYPVELDEFLKAGGAAKCLVLRLQQAADTETVESTG